MEDINIIQQESNVNDKLIPNINTKEGLKFYLNCQFATIKEAGTKAGISETRVRQILIGYKVPKSAKLIQQIARGWGFNEIKLTQLFDYIRNREQTKNGI